MRVSNNNLDNSSNINYIDEPDFNILPNDAIVWRGDFPFKFGDVFPTEEIKKRAKVYHTNTLLYKNELNDVYSGVFTWSDLNDAFTRTKIKSITPSLPSFKSCTDLWVDLLVSKAPKIDGVGDALNSLSSALSKTNFLSCIRTAVRDSLFVYGNKCIRVDMVNGGVKLVPMPVKSWVPFVNSDDFTTIECNCFFNIFVDGGREFCEFILYFENGEIWKLLFDYNGGKLGALVEETKTTSDFGVSPIVVFQGSKPEDSVFGTGTYNCWDASIASCIRAFENILLLAERSKEITRIVPEGSTLLDANSGIRYSMNGGTITYKDLESPPTVQMIVPSVDLSSAIEVYKTCLGRLASDTSLALAFFDNALLSGNVSAKAMRTSLYPTALKAEGMLSDLVLPTQNLVYKISRALNLDIKFEDFHIVYDTNFIEDSTEQMQILQARVGSKPTLSVADAIVRYDGVSRAVAERTAKELMGIEPDVVESGVDTPVVDNNDGVDFTLLNGNEINENSKTPNNDFYINPLV